MPSEEDISRLSDQTNVIESRIQAWFLANQEDSGKCEIRFSADIEDSFVKIIYIYLIIITKLIYVSNAELPENFVTSCFIVLHWRCEFVLMHHQCMCFFGENMY